MEVLGSSCKIGKCKRVGSDGYYVANKLVTLSFILFYIY